MQKVTFFSQRLVQYEKLNQILSNSGCRLDDCPTCNQKKRHPQVSQKVEWITRGPRLPGCLQPLQNNAKYPLLKGKIPPKKILDLFDCRSVRCQFTTEQVVHPSNTTFPIRKGNRHLPGLVESLHQFLDLHNLKLGQPKPKRKGSSFCATIFGGANLLVSVRVDSPSSKLKHKNTL